MMPAFASPPPARPVAWLGEKLPELKVSLEIFPPKGADAEARMWQALDRLRVVNPLYVSVTCGAGGGEARNTAEIVKGVESRLDLPAAAHLTCVAADRAGIDAIAEAYWAQGVRKIVALRGDAPQGFERPADSYPYADGLVAALKRKADFAIAVAGYPEAHPEAASFDADMDHLARKVDAGATEVITQYCFDTDCVLRYRDAMAARGIGAKLVVGVMPVHNYAQIARFSSRCGAGVPAWLTEMLDGLDDDPATAAAVAASIGAEQCRRLAVEGLTELHFYTLNRAELTLAIARLLGLRARLASAA
ncbi:methylenetetrahydrofolate reductase [Marinivivus vitaminiproducens]|uniref:methylenetetrahydrofolate reductase n=1 Tax=Marinivivus vitaminiproducens TaxID=3035935 RepID=UPI0027A85964|nr:methylenetetrahydrofolate reductase [Geminicoccaceae bacterium SCSIO 64248]